jgi:type VI secretion system protein
MALRLRIISDHRRLLGERSTITFGPAGGTIGRSSDNDWILPDPQRYVSAHHARIQFSKGQFLLEDTSTNGSFVNDDERPIRDHGPYRLQSGDVLRLGEYQIVVALEPQATHSQALPPQAGEPHPVIPAGHDPVPTHIDVLESLGRAAQTDLGAALNLDELLMAESPSGSRVRPVNAYGQAVPQLAAAGGASPAPVVASEPPEPDDEAVARRIERLARAAARAQEVRGTNPPALHGVQDGLQAFCRGAGIEVERLPAEAHLRLLHLVGRLLREALVGMKDLERGREDIRGRFRIELPSEPDDPRPSLVRTTVEDLLVALLSQHESRRLDAVQWLREAAESAKTHERAAFEALQAAFVEFVGRFDPAELEARFQRAARRSGKSADSAESRNWQLFVEFYRSLTEMPPDQLPHTFVEAFASAYRSAMKKGADRD